MKYKKFHKLIEQQNPEQKQVLHQKLKQDLNITEAPAEKQPSAFARFFKKPARLAACISAAVAVICLAIILPFALNSGNTPQTSDERFRYEQDCEEKWLDCTLKEYSEQNNISILYLDWYDFADSRASLFVNKDDETDIVYMCEELIDGEIGIHVILRILDIYTKVDVFESYIDFCEEIAYISSVQVRWGGSNLGQDAYFEYNGYRYFIELRNGVNEGSILEIVESMLP